MFASSHSRRLGGQYGYEECEPDAFSRPPCELRLSFAETRFRSRPKKIKETSGQLRRTRTSPNRTRPAAPPLSSVCPFARVAFSTRGDYVVRKKIKETSGQVTAYRRVRIGGLPGPPPPGRRTAKDLGAASQICPQTKAARRSPGQQTQPRSLLSLSSWPRALKRAAPPRSQGTRASAAATPRAARTS